MVASWITPKAAKALFDDYEGGMECACARPACRGYIDGRDWQRPELQHKYCYFSWYLDNKLRSCSNS